MKRKIWNQLTTAVLTTVIGTTTAIVSSAEASFSSSLTDLIVAGQLKGEQPPQSTTENQSITVDTRTNFAPSQSEIQAKPIRLEGSSVNVDSSALAEREAPVQPTTNPVPTTSSQPKKAVITRPTSNNNAAPAKKTQPKRINQTRVVPKPETKVSANSQETQQTKGRVSTRKRGMASWYGPGFHGRRTANGERFNQYGMTAAHRTLPIGTQVRVTNLNNGRSVVVRINDRGPFGGGRIIDLSKGAASLIGVMQSGVAPVLLEVLGR